MRTEHFMHEGVTARLTYQESLTPGQRDVLQYVELTCAEGTGAEVIDVLRGKVRLSASLLRQVMTVAHVLATPPEETPDSQTLYPANKRGKQQYPYEPL